MQFRGTSFDREFLRQALTAALALAIVFGGCSRQKAPLPGGGEHKVIAIMIRAYAKETPGKEKGPVSLQVGEPVQLRVFAAWAIPSVTEETRKTVWTVSDAAVGDVDADGVFTARKAGHAVVTAEVQISGNGAGEVLAPGQAANAGSVRTFRDKLELNVVEATGAAAEPTAVK